MTAESEIESLKRCLKEEEENKWLIDERISQYVTKPPLQLIKDKRQCEQKIKELGAQLAQRETAMQVKTEVRLDLNDPLPLANFSSEEPFDERVHFLLEDLKRAWLNDEWEEVDHLYYDAMVECGNQTAIAVAQLYLADARARNDNLEEGIEFAQRAIKNFGFKGDRHNEMVAHLLLARLIKQFQQASQSLSDVKQAYRHALVLCWELKSEVEEKLLYGRIIGKIQQALSDLEQTISDRLKERCFLHSIPVLQLSDGPDTILRPSTRMIDYVETGVFRIKKRMYFLYPLGEAERHTLEFKIGVPHFALPVPEDGWLNSTSEKGDYALVRRETPIGHEGPAVSWTEGNWVACRFKRDPTTGEIRVEPPELDIIGMSCVIGFFKPKLGG